MVFWQENEAKKNFEYFMVSVNTIDIFVQFLTPVQDYNEQWNFNSSDIAINYLTGYFALDFVSVFPVDLVTGQNAKGANAFIRIMRLKKIYKILKAKKLIRVKQLVKGTRLLMYYRLNMAFVRVMVLMGITITLNH